MKKVFLYLCWYFISYTSLLGQVTYVDASAMGLNNGSSWQNAFTTLGAAITATPAGGEIRMKVGTYTQNSTLTIDKNIIIKGGFAGTEPNGTPTYYLPSLPIFDTSGQTTKIGGSTNVFIEIDGTTPNGSITNAMVFQNIRFPGASTQQFGIKIVGSNSANSASPTIKDCYFDIFTRSAIHIDGSSGNISPIINNCKFTANANKAGTIKSGAAIYIEATGSISSSITISDCTFSNNEVLINGGAIYNNGCDNLSITNSIFNNNNADGVGGAIYSDNCNSITIMHCNFDNNNAGTGGAIGSLQTELLSITDCSFSDNESDYNGGAIFLTSALNFSDITSFFNCSFDGNMAGSFGGAIYSYANEINAAINCQFYDNQAGIGGGAIYQGEAPFKIENSVFRGNYSPEGNATYSNYQTAAVPFDMTFINNSFYQNENASNMGNACFAKGIGSVSKFFNCILWDNGEAEISLSGAATATLNHCIFDDGTSNGALQFPAGVTGTDNLDVNPLFINDSLHIDCKSIAVDFGNSSYSEYEYDIVGNNRYASPFSGITNIDVGAYEVQEVTGGVDVDFDGLVNDCDNCENNPNPAINLDGDDDYLKTVINQFGIGNQVHTIEAWLKMETLPTFRSWPIHLGQEDYGSHHWLLRANGDFEVGTFSGDQYTITNLPLQEWIHLATVFDGTMLTVYVNGVVVATINSSFNFTNKDLHLGKPRVSEDHFEGSLDEVRVWDTTRTAQQIMAYQHRELRGDEPGLLAYFDFNEGIPNGSNAAINMIPDLSGNNNDCSINNLAKTGNSSNWGIGAPIIHRDLDGNGYGDICECDPMTAGTPCDDLNANTYNDVLDAACHCAGVPFSDGCVSGETGSFSGAEGDLNLRFTTENALSCSGGNLTGEAHITYQQYLKDDWFVFEGVACNETAPIKIRRPKRLRENAATARNNYDYCFMETWEIENETCVMDILTITVYVYRDEEEVTPTNLSLNQNPIPQDLYLADNQITSEGTIASNDTVHFVAGSEIILSQGFSAISGSTFSARIIAPLSCNAPRLAPSTPIENVLEKDIEGPSLTVYPNPTSIETTIAYQLPEPSKINLVLYGLSGQLLEVITSNRVATSGRHSTKLNIENYPKGVYFIRFQTEQTQLIKKIVIQ